MSSTALQVYQKVENPLAFCKEMAKTCASMTGCNEVQGETVALVCLCEGIHPVDFQRKYHLIQGKPAMRSDAMLSEFRMNHGGDYEKIERSPQRAAIKFTDSKGRVYDEELTREQALESRWPWKDWKKKDEGLKDNWATDLDMKNMLWARLVSDSLRAICPELVAGIYTPEEMSDVDPPAAARVVAGNSPSAAEIMAGQAAANASDTIEGELVDDGEPPFEQSSEPGPNDNLADAVRELFIQAFGDDAANAIEAALAKRNCGSLRALSREALIDLKDKITAKIKAAEGN